MRHTMLSSKTEQMGPSSFSQAYSRIPEAAAGGVSLKGFALSVGILMNVVAALRGPYHRTKAEPHCPYNAAMQEVCKPFSLWAALKGLIGKDILDAPLPIGQYCPLTELQFRCDELECTYLLDQVIACWRLPKCIPEIFSGMQTCSYPAPGLSSSIWMPYAPARHCTLPSASAELLHKALGKCVLNLLALPCRLPSCPRAAWTGCCWWPHLHRVDLQRGCARTSASTPSPERPSRCAKRQPADPGYLLHQLHHSHTSGMSFNPKHAAHHGSCYSLSACDSILLAASLSILCLKARPCMQLVRPEQGMRAVLESVHHDYSRRCRIINAWHAEGAEWTLTGEDEPTVSFWGSSLDMHLNWTDNLTFADGETFSWRKVSCLWIVNIPCSAAVLLSQQIHERRVGPWSRP